MVDDNIHFEQRYFLRSIAEGLLNVKQLLEWYNTVVRDDLRNADSSDDYITDFARAVIGIVSDNDPSPPTFVFDFDRIRVLQIQFRKCMYQMICREAFSRSLWQLGYTATVPANAYHTLLYRISNLNERNGSSSHSSLKTDDVALEIVREAYHLRGIEALPDEVFAEGTRHWLLQAWNVESPIYQDLEYHLSNILDELVDEQLGQIAKLTPLQILNHSTTLQPPLETGKELDGIKGMAQSIAHITILHWRVWSPILYLQPHKTATSSKKATIQQPTSKFSLDLGGFSENDPREATPASSRESLNISDSDVCHDTKVKVLTATEKPSVTDEPTHTVISTCNISTRGRRCSSPLG